MFSIVANENAFIVIDKAPGISFHRDGESAGLLATVREQAGCPQLYPVHRLDRITSGLLVMAKTPAANRELSMQFQSRQVEKYYLALSARKPKKKQGLVKGDMARSRRGGWKLLPSAHNPAITQFFSCGVGEGIRLFLLKPHTGKTHQLRVALKSLGAPVMGDPLYGPEHEQPLDRGYLHAFALGFQFENQDYRYILPPDAGEHFARAGCVEAIAAYSRPWALPWPEIAQ